MDNEKAKIDLRDQILRTIEAKHIKMRPRWQFLVEKIGLESALVLVFLLTSTLLSLLYLYTKVNEIHRLFEFGPVGYWYFIKQFPFEIFIFIAIFLYLFNRLAKRLEINYKIRPLYWYGLLALLFLIIFSLAEIIGLHKNLEDYEKQVEAPLFKNYFGARLHNIVYDSLEGDILEMNDEQVILQMMIDNIPSTTSIRRQNLNLGHPITDMRSGDHIRVIGKPNQAKFEAWGAYKK